MKLLTSFLSMETSPPEPLALALHGGSGTLSRSLAGAEEAGAYRAALAEAREVGWTLLVKGLPALEVVEAVVRWLEDCPLFNAGRGSVYTADETHELDAAIMCGRRLRAGAVAGLRTVRHPVSLARLTMERSPFVLLAGEGAEAFADTTEVERVDPSWFGTDERRRQLEEARAHSAVLLDHDARGRDKTGTVGVVALDARGDLAAATSTGGLTNKRFGRIGDTPVIGAGTYADNLTCAVSCTGYGEEFIRAVVAHDVSCRIAYLGESLEVAATAVVMDKLPLLGGRGGLVAVDRQGRVSLPFNTEGMYRAWRTSRDPGGVAIFAGDAAP
jgi:L-asparaginase / beta-aspartyl-peptidase